MPSFVGHVPSPVFGFSSSKSFYKTKSIKKLFLNVFNFCLSRNCRFVYLLRVPSDTNSLSLFFTYRVS